MLLGRGCCGECVGDREEFGLRLLREWLGYVLRCCSLVIGGLCWVMRTRRGMLMLMWPVSVRLGG